MFWHICDQSHICWNIWFFLYVTYMLFRMGTYAYVYRLQRRVVAECEMLASACIRSMAGCIFFVNGVLHWRHLYPATMRRSKRKSKHGTSKISCCDLRMHSSSNSLTVTGDQFFIVKFRWVGMLYWELWCVCLVYFLIACFYAVGMMLGPLQPETV